MSRPNLKLVNTDTGELVADEHEPCIHCGRVENQTLLRDLENAEHDLRKARAKIKRLERDKQAERDGDPERSTIEALFRHWQVRTGKHKSKLTPDRFDAIKQALKLYSAEQLELAIEGIAAFPFVVNGDRVPAGPENMRHMDVTLAVSVGKRIEKLANLGYQERRKVAS